MKYIFHIFALALFFLYSCELSALTLSKEATFYSDSFEGGKTSNGEILHQDGYTAAACDIALGKNVYVFSENTGAIIHINDRPNCTRYPNVLDLTRKVFTLFAPESVGRIPSLQVNTLDPIEPHIFASLGIELDPAPASVYFVGDGVSFEGRVTDGKTRVLLFLQNNTTKEEISKLVIADASGQFHVVLTLPSTPGKYSLVLASGNSFKTETSATLTLVDPLSMNYPFLPQNRTKMTPILDQSNNTALISLGSAFWGNMDIRQDMKSVQMSGSRFVFDQSLPFHTGNAQVNIDGYTIGSGGPLDKITKISNVFSGSIILDRTHEKTGKKFVSIRNNTTFTTLKFRVPSTPKLRSNYYLTLPNGDVREFDFSKEYIGIDGFLISGKKLTLTLPTNDKGTYLIESVQANGIAYFNLPIIRGPVWNILSSYSPSSASLIEKNTNTVESYIVNNVNKIRAALGRRLVVVDPEFTRLAQAKADDMVQRNYYGHQDPDGNYIGALAEKIGVKIEGEFRENIAYGEGDIGYIVLQDGLEESGSHRFAMILPNYAKIGIGYARSGNKTFIVHILGE